MAGMTGKLEGRVAIVTGGASGIGAAAAAAMAAEGARVVVADLNEAGATDVVERIEKAGGQALAFVADVTRARDNQALVERAVAAWGRLDVFYANAGAPQWKTDIEEVDEAVFDRIMAVNVKGVWLGAKFAVPVMKRQRRGVFLITSSTSGIRPRPGGQTYAASKGAVITFAKALALEVAPHGVRVVSIAPVATETPMLPTFMNRKDVDDESRARYVATIPLGRLNQPEDVARAAVFLASDDAAMITGSTVEVDGGRCI
jgi:3-oxoacyl-[acyl-carrier protein] reductase